MPLVPHLVRLLEDLRPREDRDLTSPVFPGLSDQGLRHRYTSLLVAAGVPITLVQKVVGHAREDPPPTVAGVRARPARSRMAGTSWTITWTIAPIPKPISSVASSGL